MDKAEELLNTLDVNDENLYPVSPYEEAHIVIGKDRVITVPPDLRRLGVQYDKMLKVLRLIVHDIGMVLICLIWLCISIIYVVIEKLEAIMLLTLLSFPMMKT